MRTPLSLQEVQRGGKRFWSASSWQHSWTAGRPTFAIERLMAGARPAITVSIRAVLQRVQEVDEVRLLLVGEADGEALVVEVDHVQQGLGRAVMEVRRA